MSNLKELFTQFNLNDQEAEIYLAVLALGSCSVQDIAKKMGKSRTAIYFHVEHLLQKSMLKETRQGKLKRLIATPPGDVVSTLDKHVTELKSVLPVLESLQKASSETPIIEVTESRRGFRKVYDEIASLPVGSIFRIVEGPEAVRDELTLLSEQDWFEFFTRIVERNIITKALFTESALTLPAKKLAKKNLELIKRRAWNLRTIPDAVLPLQKMVLFYGKKMAILFPDTQLVVVIQHEAITQQFVLLFDALFEQGAQIRQPWA